MTPLGDQPIQTVLPIDEYFLRSDYTPTRTEVNKHSQLLEDDRHFLEHCNDEIGRVSRTLEELKGKREEITQRVRLRKAFLSPIRRVPVEIWRTIFSFVCFSLESSVSFTHGVYAHALPYVLLCVCAHWFHIVNGFPQLWSSIYITPKCSGLQDIAPILLEKSRNSPLTIRIPFLKEYHPDTLNEMFKVLAAHAFRRCKHLTIDYFWWNLLIQKRINISFPALESLDTKSWAAARTYTHPFAKPRILNVPLLNQLKISSPHWEPKIIHFPYAQLTSLKLMPNIALVGVLLEVLPLCSNLQCLVTPFYAREVYTGRRNSPVIIPSLQHLKLYMSSFQHDLFSLCQHFQFPNLSSLVIWDVYHHFSSLNTAPSHPEYHLSFQRSFAGSPSLTSLQLIHQPSEPELNIFNALLLLLTISPTDILLPKLTSLIIYPYVFFCFNCRVTTSKKIELERNILNMVASRTRYSKLSELRLEYRTKKELCKCQYHGISTFLEGLEVHFEQHGLKWRIREVGNFDAALRDDNFF